MFNSRKKKNAKVLANYQTPKRDSFDFERISLFFSNNDFDDAFQLPTYRTLNDLDFEELFMYMDRTCSKIGQQFLYSLIRIIPKGSERFDLLEKNIKFLESNPESKEKLVLELSRLNEHEAYFIQNLFSKENLKKPSWFWIIPTLSGISMALMVFSIFQPVLILALMPLIIINVIIHIWNKKNIITYSNSIPQLLILYCVAKSILRLNVPSIDKVDFQSQIDDLAEISRSAIFFKVDNKLDSEMGQFANAFLEMIKAIFLLEPILTFKVIGKLSTKKDEIKQLFIEIGKIDAAISVNSFRNSLLQYCIPDTSKNKQFASSEMYHPLIHDAVSNDMTINDHKSILISGSNMSGKTTFIRTIGVNALMAQTINTATAKSFSIPKMKIHSAIHINDNLMNDTSYYFEEVKTVKHMIDEVDAGDKNLFLLDELFKGTNTVERIASAKSVLEHLVQNRNLVFVSTHDIELLNLLNSKFDYYHFQESVENGTMYFDYKLKKGAIQNTNAIKILEINDFPREVTAEAKRLARQLMENKASQWRN